MNPLSNLPSYIRSSTQKREIMDEETARIVVLYVQRFFDEVKADLTNSVLLRNQIRAWLHSITHHRTGAELCVSTKRSIAGIIGRYCRDSGWLLPDDHITLVNAFRPRVDSWSTKALTTEQTDRLIRHLRHKADNSLTKSRNLLATMVMLAAGLRIGQIVALDTSDVTISQTTITVMPILQKSYKQGKSAKVIPLNIGIGNVVMREAVEMFERLRDKNAIAYFHNADSDYISSAYFRKLFGNIEKRLGFTISAHSCRHTAGTRIANSVGITAAANVLGHTNIRTTQRYVSFEEQKTEDIIAGSFL